MEGTALIDLKKFKKTEPTTLEIEITRLFDKLQAFQPETDQYDKVTEQIAKLYKLKEIDSKKRVSSDVMFGAASNLAGILLILNFEHAHVMTSKAISFVGKKLIS
jgi:hypothetical protein